MRRIVPDHIEERFAHVEEGTIEDERVGALIDDPLAHGVCVAGGDDVEPVVAQREGQELCDLRRVVDEQNASRRVHFLPEPAPGSRFFLPAEGSRSSTHTRPPAV